MSLCSYWVCPVGTGYHGHQRVVMPLPIFLSARVGMSPFRWKRNEDESCLFFWENKYMCICTSTKHVEHYNRLPFQTGNFRTLPLAIKKMDHQSLTRRVKHERDNIMLPIIWKNKPNSHVQERGKINLLFLYKRRKILIIREKDREHNLTRKKKKKTCL